MFRLPAVLAILAFSTAAHAQAPLSGAPQQVSTTAPQLVQFSGSQANFEAIVNGITQGIPVTIITVDAAGNQQTVTFTPTATVSAADAARVIESARNTLITRGVATPTAQQIAVALVGGPLATPAGTVTVSPAIPGITGTTLVQVRNDVGVATSVSAGATAITGNNLQSLRTSLAQAGLTPFEVSQSLQLASTIRLQNGIVTPTAEQIQIALVGGSLLLPNGALVPIQGVLQGRLPAGGIPTAAATSGLPSTAVPTSNGFQIPTPTAPTAGTPQFGSATQNTPASSGGTAGFRRTR
jgi:hypothetical protein